MSVWWLYTYFFHCYQMSCIQYVYSQEEQCQWRLPTKHSWGVKNPCLEVNLLFPTPWLSIINKLQQFQLLKQGGRKNRNVLCIMHVYRKPHQYNRFLNTSSELSPDKSTLSGGSGREYATASSTELSAATASHSYLWALRSVHRGTAFTRRQVQSLSDLCEGNGYKFPKNNLKFRLFYESLRIEHECNSFLNSNGTENMSCQGSELTEFRSISFGVSDDQNIINSRCK